MSSLLPPPRVRRTAGLLPPTAPPSTAPPAPPAPAAPLRLAAPQAARPAAPSRAHSVPRNRPSSPPPPVTDAAAGAPPIRARRPGGSCAGRGRRGASAAPPAGAAAPRERTAAPGPVTAPARREGRTGRLALPPGGAPLGGAPPETPPSTDAAAGAAGAAGGAGAWAALQSELLAAMASVLAARTAAEDADLAAAARCAAIGAAEAELAAAAAQAAADADDAARRARALRAALAARTAAFDAATRDAHRRAARLREVAAARAAAAARRADAAPAARRLCAAAAAAVAAARAHEARAELAWRKLCTWTARKYFLEIGKKRSAAGTAQAPPAAAGAGGERGAPHQAGGHSAAWLTRGPHHCAPPSGAPPVPAVRPLVVLAPAFADATRSKKLLRVKLAGGAATEAAPGGDSEKNGATFAASAGEEREASFPEAEPEGSTEESHADGEVGPTGTTNSVETQHRSPEAPSPAAVANDENLPPGTEVPAAQPAPSVDVTATAVGGEEGGVLEIRCPAELLRLPTDLTLYTVAADAPLGLLHTEWETIAVATPDKETEDEAPTGDAPPAVAHHAPPREVCTVREQQTQVRDVARAVVEEFLKPQQRTATVLQIINVRSFRDAFTFFGTVAMQEKATCYIRVDPIIAGAPENGSPQIAQRSADATTTTFPGLLESVALTAFERFGGPFDADLAEVDAAFSILENPAPSSVARKKRAGLRKSISFPDLAADGLCGVPPLNLAALSSARPGGEPASTLRERPALGLRELLKQVRNLPGMRLDGAGAEADGAGENFPDFPLLDDADFPLLDDADFARAAEPPDASPALGAERLAVERRSSCGSSGSAQSHEVRDGEPGALSPGQIAPETVRVRAAGELLSLVQEEVRARAAEAGGTAPLDRCSGVLLRGAAGDGRGRSRALLVLDLVSADAAAAGVARLAAGGGGEAAGQLGRLVAAAAAATAGRTATCVFLSAKVPAWEAQEAAAAANVIKALGLSADDGGGGG